MSHLRPVDCLQVEERLLGGLPVEAAALLGGGDAAVAGHLRSCPGCAALARDLAALDRLPPVAPPAHVVATTLSAASAELARVHAASRSAVRRAAFRVALVAALCLPLPLLWALGIWQLGATWLAPLLPAAAASLLGAGFALAVLAALSAVAFTLTLLVGAAAHPPRRPLLEV